MGFQLPSAPPVVCIGCCAEKALRPLFRDITLRSHRIFWKNYVLRRWTTRCPIEWFCWKHGKPGTCRTCYMDDEFCEVLTLNEWRLFGWKLCIFLEFNTVFNQISQISLCQVSMTKDNRTPRPFLPFLWGAGSVGPAEFTRRSCTQVAILYHWTGKVCLVHEIIIFSCRTVFLRRYA